MATQAIEHAERGTVAETTDAPNENREYDNAVDVEYSDTVPDDECRFRFSFKRFWKFCGPAWLMSLA